MKLVSFEKEGRPGYGILDGDRISDVSSELSDRYPDLKSILNEGIDLLEVSGQFPTYALADIKLLPVIPNPGSVWCAGLNTHSHLAEVSAIVGEKEAPEIPMFFLRAPGTLVGSGENMERPKTEPAFDYEGEIAVIIGKACRSVSEDEAMDYVAGYSCFNDGTARRYQKRSEQMTTAKNSWRSGGFGPCMVTADSVELKDLVLTTRVNGEQRQEMTPDDLIFSVPYLISHISEVYELQPGDVIVTGSAAGIGAAMQPMTFLQPGDLVEVEVSGIGTLTNAIVEQVS